MQKRLDHTDTIFIISIEVTMILFTVFFTGARKRWLRVLEVSLNEIIQTFCRRVLICIREVLFPILHAAI